MISFADIININYMITYFGQKRPHFFLTHIGPKKTVHTKLKYKNAENKLKVGNRETCEVNFVHTN